MRDSLYLRRPLENASDLIAWAKGQGFKTALHPGDMHVTIAYSKSALDWPAARDDKLTVASRLDRSLERFGQEGAERRPVVLRFANETLQSRWAELKAMGASYDFPDYKPHVTISWNADDVAIEGIKPYDGELIFGPEIMRPIDPDWTPGRITEKVGARHTRREYDLLRQIYDAVIALGVQMPEPEQDEDVIRVVKVDEELGIVFGWGIISNIAGQPYFDTQGDHIPDDGMLHAVAEFSEGGRVGKEMHVGSQKGQIVFTFPLTADVAKAMGISCPYTGWMVGYKPATQSILAKFKDGTYTGFSIGGRRIIDEMVRE